MPRRSPPAPTTDEPGGGARPPDARAGASRAGPPSLPPEVWLPALYAVAAVAWIAISDHLVARVADGVEQQAAWSVVKGILFVLVTATLLHGVIRWALARERRAVRRLVENEALLRAIAEATPDPVFLKDRESRWLFANQATLRVVGKPAAEILGRNDLELYPDPALAAALMAADRQVVESGRESTFEERVETPAGVRLFLSTKAPFRDPDGRVVGVIGSARDITDRKRAEEALRDSEERLRQAQKLESIGRLAGGIAHDFNNLLTVILSCTESLDEQLSRGLAASAEELQEIRAAGKRASDLTRQLLAFARKQVIAPVALDLNTVVGGSEKLLRRVLGEDIELVVSLRPGLWLARCDPGQLEQVLLNLAVNSRDAMRGGGTLTIETENVQGCEDYRGRASERRDGEYVRLSVRDTGVGLSAEAKDHLFEPFFTTKPTGHGTGLGLATTYGIVKQSGGAIHVESEPGRGATFHVYLPRTLEAASPAPTPAPAVAASTRGEESVLVVEDDPQVREVTVRAMRAGGYQVSVAASPQEALALPAEDLARIRLLLTDVVMPGHSGPAIADALRARHPALRVLYVSGYTRDFIAERGILDPGVEFLGKPFTGHALLQRVRTILDG